MECHTFKSSLFTFHTISSHISYTIISFEWMSFYVELRVSPVFPRLSA